MKWKTSASIEHKLQPGLRFCHVMDAQSRNLRRGRVKGRRAFQEGRLVSDDDAGLFCLVGEGLEKLLLASIGQGTESITSSDTWQTQKRNSTLTSSKSGDVRLYRTATQPRGHFQKTGNLNVLRFNQDDNDKHRRKCPSKSRCGLFQLVC